MTLPKDPPLTLADLERLARLEQHLESTPWLAINSHVFGATDEPLCDCATGPHYSVTSDNDRAEFIAAFRNHARALLALARRQVEQQRESGPHPKRARLAGRR